MYFDGEPNPRKINLGGRSKASGSRGDLMRKAREERHERAEQKRRTGASTRVAAWWRGRSAAAKARRAVRQAWDGQMRDLEAVRTVFASRGARFEAPPATVSALAQSFLFFANNTRAVFFAKKDDDSRRRLETICACLFQFRDSARRGLNLAQCRGLLEAALVARAGEEESSSKNSSSSSSYAKVVASAASDVLRGTQEAPFARETLFRSVASLGPASARLRARSSSLADFPRASLVASRDFPLLRGPACRAFAVHVLSKTEVTTLDDRDVADACDEAAEVQRRRRRALDDVFLSNVASALVRAEDPDVVAGPIAAASAAVASTLSRSAFLEVSTSRRGASSSSEKLDDEDDDDDEEEEEPEEVGDFFPQQRRRQEVKSRSTSGAPVVLLDARTSAEVSRREARLRPRARRSPSSLFGPPFWERLFEAVARAPTDGDRLVTSAARLGAAVAAASDPAPRARVAVFESPPAVATIYEVIAARPAVLKRLWRLAAVDGSLSLVDDDDDDEDRREDDDRDADDQKTDANNRGPRVNREEEKDDQEDDDDDKRDAWSGRGGAFVLFCKTLSYLLLTLDNEALADESELTIRELLAVAGSLRDALYRDLWVVQILHTSNAASFQRVYATSVAARLLNQLRDRLRALKAVEPDFFHWRGVHLSERLVDDAGGSSLANDDDDVDMADAANNQPEDPSASTGGRTRRRRRRRRSDLGDDEDGLGGGGDSDRGHDASESAADDDDDDDEEMARPQIVVGRQQQRKSQDCVALSREPRVAQVLAALPFAVPFAQRVALFGALVERDRARHQDEHDGARTLGFQQRGIRATIRRSHVFEDAYEALSVRARDLKSRVQVTFVNEAGHEEAGIDGGGVFKEFLDQVAKAAFVRDELFDATEGRGALYPKPAASSLTTAAQSQRRGGGSGGDGDHREDHGATTVNVAPHLAQVEFCGRLVAKALYERVLIEPRFASFFLNKALGRFNYFDDLDSLDPELYRSLVKLKRLPASQVADLGLTFDVTAVDEAGVRRDVELLPQGRHLKVDATNRGHYVQLVAHHRLNVEPAAVSAAFLRGLRAAIPLRWLRMFDPGELQHLISGDDSPVDVDDLRRHVHYGGGYHPSQPYIIAFWQILTDFDADERAKFLKFVTSCSRPPLLGFQRLRPLICIHKVNDTDRLPTSGTCMNLLKLPQYDDTATLRDKLLYAINEAHGFELS